MPDDSPKTTRNQGITDNYPPSEEARLLATISGQLDDILVIARRAEAAAAEFLPAARKLASRARGRIAGWGGQ
jgi:hypothetical protein